MKSVDFLKPGGFPFVLDDLAYSQSGLIEAVSVCAAMFRNVGIPSYIMYGCISTEGGAVFLHGEICKVDPGSPLTSANPGEVLVWAFDDSFDPSGDKTLEDTTTVQVYKTRKAKIQSKVYDAAVHMLVAGAPRFENRIYSLMDSPDWIDGVAGEWKYRKTRDGFVHVVGLIDGASTLPVGYRPASNQSFKAMWFDYPSDPSYTDVTITTAGVITATILTGAGTHRMVNLSGISFKAA